MNTLDRVRGKLDKCSDGTTAHHFMIPSPNGRKAKGVCKKCGKVRDHLNSIDWTQWQAGRYHHGYTKPNPRSLKSKK